MNSSYCINIQTNLLQIMIEIQYLEFGTWREFEYPQGNGLESVEQIL